MSKKPPKAPDTSSKAPVNMGPFGNDEEVKKLVEYGLEYDRQRLIAAGKIPVSRGDK